MTGFYLKINGAEKALSVEFYIERERAVKFSNDELIKIFRNGKVEYYAFIDASFLGRGNLLSRVVFMENDREIVVKGFTGYTIPCMGEGGSICCEDYCVLFEKVDELPGSDEWDADKNMNDFVMEGYYRIYGYRQSEDDNLPIMNMGAVDGRLLVVVSENCVTQVLTLLNVGGGEGNVYIRTKQNDTWKPWGKLQTNIEVGLVDSLDNFRDNGMYSGVFGAETFVLVVINNYVIATQAGYGGYISQLKYSVDLQGAVTVKTRRSDAYGNWSAWEDLKGQGGGSYTLPVATKDTLGGIKTSTAQSDTPIGTEYGVRVFENGKAYVLIPHPADVVAEGNTSAVASGAVYDAINSAIIKVINTEV